MKKKVFGVLGLLLICLIGVFVFAWRNLNERINSPEFKDQLETHLSRLLQGTMDLGALRASLGIRPSVVLTEIRYVSEQGDIQIEAGEFLFFVKPIPLLRHELVFSDVTLNHPSIRLRRRSDGTGPVIPVLKKQPGQPAKKTTFQINNLSIHKGIFQWVDESRPGKPSLTMTADLNAQRNPGGDETHIQLSGTLENDQGRGRFQADGKRGADTFFQFSADRVPFGLVAEFWPAASAVSGAFSVTGSYSNKEDKTHWRLEGKTNDVRWATTNRRLPIEAQWTLAAGEPVTVRTNWKSELSQMKATVVLPDLKGSLSNNWPISEETGGGEFKERRGRDAGHRNRGATRKSPRLGSSRWVDGHRPVPLPNSPYMPPACAGNLASARRESHRRKCASYNLTNPKSIHVQATMKAERLDAGELSDIFSQSSSLSSSFPSTTSWTLRAKADVDHFVAGQWEAQDVRAVVRASPATVSLPELAFRMAGGTVTVRGEARRTDPIRSVWDMAIQTELINLDLADMTSLVPDNGFRRGTVRASGKWHWLGPVNPGSSLRKKSLWIFSPFATWDCRVDVSSADWKGVPIEKAGVDLLWSDNEFRAPTMAARACDGTLTAEGTVLGLTGDGPGTFTVRGTMNNIETRELMAALSTSAYLVNGRFSGNLDISGPWRPWTPGQWNGHLSLLGQNGEFRTAPAVLSVFNSLKISSLLRTFAGKKEMGLPFDVVTASATLESGRLVIDPPLFVKNPSFQVAFNGWVDPRFENGKGTILFNFLQGTTNLVKKLPLISSLILSPDGEFLPLVADVAVENGQTTVIPRSVKTLTGPLVEVVKNVFRFPIHLFSPPKKNKIK